MKIVIRFSPNYPNYKYLLKKFPSIFLDATIIHFWPLPKYVLNEVAESYIKAEAEEDENFVSLLKSFITEC